MRITATITTGTTITIMTATRAFSELVCPGRAPLAGAGLWPQVAATAVIVHSL